MEITCNMTNAHSAKITVSAPIILSLWKMAQLQFSSYFVVPPPLRLFSLLDVEILLAFTIVKFLASVINPFWSYERILT